MTFTDYKIRLVINIIAAAEARSPADYDLPHLLRKALASEVLPALVRQRRLGRTFKGHILSASGDSRRLETAILTQYFGTTPQGRELVRVAVSKSRFTVPTLKARKPRKAAKQ